jgi:dUTPase
MKIFVKKTGAVLPSQATPDDAGYDIIATTEGKIVGQSIERPFDGMKVWSRVAFIEYGTNLFIAPEDISYTDDLVGSSLLPKTFTTKFHTLLHPRSSISKYNLVLANSIGLVDNGYRGQILVRFKYIFQPEDLVIVPEAGVQRVYGIVRPENIYNQGDKIVQIKASKNVPIEWEFIDDLSQTVRADGGFGSSDVKQMTE